jgi:SpoVK/Ycf46/Vps4 family AAA+-type ATPase
LIISEYLKSSRDYYASLIAGLRRREAYKINTAVIVSKYIGETEKTLDMIFADAAKGSWVLFFDEADQLFSNSREPESLANTIQKLALERKVPTLFWCEDDCLKWLGRSKYIIIE